MVIPLSLWLAVEQAAQMDADDLAPVPGTGERVVARRRSFRHRGDRGVDVCRVERASFESAFGALGPNGGRRHGAECNAGADGAAAPGRPMCGERHHPAAPRLDAPALAVAKRPRAGPGV